MNKSSKIICLLLLILFWPKVSSAYQISSVANTGVSNDFVVGQGKNEVSLNPGEEKIQNVFILNRSGRALNFTVTVEDFLSTDQAQESLKFLPDQTGPYPAKSWLIPEVFKFTLKQGEKMTLPVLVKINRETTPGGLYGAVMISAQPSDSISGSQVKSTARLASLFLVRVKGEVAESGKLEKFSSPKGLYRNGPVDFFYDFKNSGNIYLNPHGEIVVTNLFGKVVHRKSIAPYFVLPGATRQQKETWSATNKWGYYRATISLSRGYGEYIDRRSINLCILPWFGLVVVSIILVAIIGLIIGLVMRSKKK